MKDQKITLGFETPTDEAHDTHIIHMTVSELRRAVAARFEAIIDNTDNGDGPLKGLWDAIDFGECDIFWVSDADDNIMLEGSGGMSGIFGEDRPVMVLYNWLETNNAAIQMEVRQQ